MKNITVTIDDETHTRARVRAAELGTSVSALVKAYLSQLADGPLAQAQQQAQPEGVLDMQMAFKAEPASLSAPLPGQKGPEGQPYCVNGKWVWTKDGKPRKPGAMRHLLDGWDGDFDGWPDGFIDAMYGEDTPASNTWWLNANDVLKKPKGQ